MLVIKKIYQTLVICKSFIHREMAVKTMSAILEIPIHHFILMNEQQTK